MGIEGIQGKTAIVTGATEGIGLATAHLLSERGVNLVLVARREDRGREVVDRIGRGSAVFLAADVAEPESATSAVELAMERFGRLDVLVNNAAMDFVRPIAAVKPEEVLEVLSVNFIAVLAMVQRAVPALRASGGGAIVNVSSRAASVGLSGMAVYSASKGAVESLTRVAAIELAADSIRVNAVAPGLTTTPLVEAWLGEQADPDAFRARLETEIPQGRFARPEEVAAAIAFLAGPESAHVTGAVLPVDGGYTAQ